MHHTYDVEVEADQYDDLEALRYLEEEQALRDGDRFDNGHDDLFEDGWDDVPF